MNYLLENLYIDFRLLQKSWERNSESVSANFFYHFSDDKFYKKGSMSISLKIKHNSQFNFLRKKGNNLRSTADSMEKSLKHEFVYFI